MSFSFCAVCLTVLGVFLGTLGSLKMSISSRRNTDFHVFYPRKCDVEIGTRTNRKKLSFWKDLGLHFCDFSLLKRVLKASQNNTRKKIKKNVILAVFWGRPGGMCGRRGETREGSEIQNCRILEKDIGKKFFKSSFVNSWILVQHARPFPTGRAAERSAHSAVPFWMLRGLGGQVVGELR